MGLKAALNAAMGVMPPGLAEAAASFARLYPGRRAAFVLEEATRNPQLQQRLAEAAASDTPNVLFARIAADFEPPAAGARYAMESEPLPTPNPEPQLRAGVAEELGPFYLEAPMESVNEARRMLGPTSGGDDLVNRLGGMTPRPLYSLDLPGDNTVLSQMDAAAGPFSMPGEPRGLIIQGGRGVPVGGPTGSGTVVPGPTALSTQVTPRTRIPGPPQRRLKTTAGVPVGEVTPQSSPRVAPEQPRLESPDVVQERRAMESLGDAVASDEAAARFHRANLREGMAEQAARAREVADDVVRKSAIAAGIGALGIGAYETARNPGWLVGMSGVEEESPEPRLVPDITSKPKPMSTADLAAEMSPPPVVEAPVQIDYSQMARDKIRQANEIQLREGRITPESAALSREADALYQRAAEERRRGNHPPIMPVEMQDAQTSAIRNRRGPEGADPRSAARRILADLNAGRIPPAQRAKAQAEMQRLYRLADDQDNAARGVMMGDNASRAVRADRAVAEYEDATGMSLGNGADLDNLDGAAADLVVEDILGGPLSRPSVPQSERVFKDDPTGGLAGVVAAREAAADANWAERGEYYDAKEQEQSELYGPYGDPSAVNNQQQMNRDRVAQREARVRHNPRQEEARIRRLADRAGIPYAEAEAMVQAGYDREADRMKMPADSRWDVAAPGNPTALPEFSTFSEAHKDLRQLGSDRRAADKAARQQAVQRTRQAQTNPLEYLNRNDISDWNRMVAADRMLGRGYRGATPLDVDEATQQALALQEARRGLGQGFQDQNQLIEARTREANDTRMREGRAKAAAVLNWLDTDAGRRREGARLILQRAGYSREEIELILNELFADPPPPAVDTGPPRPGQPGGVGDMGQGLSM